MCGVWCVVCGVWYVAVCGEHGCIPVSSGFAAAVSGAWSIGYVVWYMVFGLLLMFYGVFLYPVS